MNEVRPGVFLVSLGRRGAVSAALRSGARGVLPETATDSEIRAAAAAVDAGLVVLHPDAADALLPTTAHGPTAPGYGDRHALLNGQGDHLTPRESEVLNLLADGLGNKQIAAHLGISDHTVKAHLGAIFEKLGVSTRTEAVALGARMGLIVL